MSMQREKKGQKRKIDLLQSCKTGNQGNDKILDEDVLLKRYDFINNILLFYKAKKQF